MSAPMWGSKVTQKTLIENISLLQVLNEVPEKPKENCLETQSDQVHRLELRREKEIAANLAFLSSTTDDNKKVMAVCVQEDGSGRGITIRVASNSGDLARVVQGFEGLGRILERAAQRKNLKFDDIRSLLREVVKMDAFRILSRLRSAHAPRSMKIDKKQLLIPLLKEALSDRCVIARYGLSSDTLEDLRNRANCLARLSDRLEELVEVDVENNSDQNILMEIVAQSNELSLTSQLGPALHTSTVLNPSLKTSLPKAFGKLGRYYAASSELVRAARDKHCRVFLSVGVEACQFPVSREHLSVKMPASIQDVAKRISQSSAMSPGLQKRVRSQLSSLQPKFEEKVSETTLLGRIHAEIQILFFYELHPKIFRPRVICSSKSACYLCNLFFQIHRQFHMPGTHGRLYNRWLLPDWLDGDLPAESRVRLGVVVRRLNESLENKIRQEFARNSQPRNPHPCESYEFIPAHWPSTSNLPESSTSSLSSTSTLRQVVSNLEERGSISNQNRSAVILNNIEEHPHEEDSPEILPNANGGISSSSSGTTTPTADNKSTSRSQMESPPHTMSPSPRSSKCSHHQLASPTLPSGFHNYRQEQHLSHRQPLWHHLRADNTPLLVSTPSIHASVSPDIDGKVGKLEEECRWAQLTWLREKELQGMQEDESKADYAGRKEVVNLKDLEPGKDVLLRPPVGDLYLCHGGDVLLIRHSLSGPG